MEPTTPSPHADDDANETNAERARWQANLETAQAALQRLNEKLEEINAGLPPAGSDLNEAPEEDGEARERWEEMSDEEKEQFSRLMRQALEEHRDQLPPDAKIAGLDVDVAIARMKWHEERLEALSEVREELTDLGYQLVADQGDIGRTLVMHTVRIMEHLEGLSEERWAAIPVEQRTRVLDLLNAWRNGEREKFLSQLPIEDRRKFE